jgi:hypothetical protein
MKAEVEHDPPPPPRTVGVAEAAAHFGISTLRIRHRLRTGSLKGFRDNRGHWQVRLDGAAVSPGRDRTFDRDVLADMLVEELLEAKDRIDDQEQSIQRLRDIIERQQEIIDRTVERLGRLNAAQSEATTVQRLRKTLDRTIALLENSLDQQETANARAERFRAMMARAIELLETLESNGASASPTVRVTETLHKAVTLGDRAVARAEISSHHAAQLDRMLERALTAAEEQVEAQKLAELRLTRRDELLERSLSLIEAATSRAIEKRKIRSRLFSFFSRWPRRPAGP